MRKKAAGILKAVWTIVISVALISAGLMCLSLQKQVEELSRLPKNVLVYDRSRKEIVEYYGTPERIGNSLVLHDANILNIEDVSHLVSGEYRRLKKARKSSERRLLWTCFSCFGMTYLHEQKGWGKQRLENYYDGCMDLLKEFEDGKHTIKSLRDKLVEETKINLAEVKE